MGQASTRAAVVAALTSQEFPGVGAVHAARAYISEQDYEQNAMGFYTQTINLSGAVLVVNLGINDVRSRFVLVGRGNVGDWNIHRVAIEIFFANRGGDAVQAQFDYDNVVDEIVIYIRNNPTLSAPITVWSAGEYRFGVQHRQSAMFTTEDGPTVFIHGVIEFESWEQIMGTGV
jgi:hypothetical protein